MGTDQISSLQALLALLWRSVTRSRRFPEDQESWYAFLIGMRPRMRPPLPQQYFGAAAQSGILKMKAGELLECGLGHAAWQMNKMFAAYTALEATNFLESWIKNPMPFPLINFIINNSLCMSGSPRFNVYGTDFGWGRLIAVRSGGGNKPYGKTTLFQGADEGSIDIEACLFPETFEAMMEDAEFMEAVIV